MKKPAARRARDPFLARESARYDAPIPSREFILDTLDEAGEPLGEADLARALGIRADEREAFARRLAAMEREGQILRNRKGALLVAKKLDLIAGRVEGHAEGYGFVAPDDGGPDLYLPPREMRKVLNGDRVMVRATGIDRRGRTEAAIVEVIARANSRIVGTLRREHALGFVVASDRRISQEILLEPGGEGKARPGQVAVVELSAQPSVDSRDVHTQPIGRVVEVLGDATDPGIEIEIALRKHELPFEFPLAALKQA
ncbi:MAG: ribonuclease R, partial [Betaproteobacteria bacterium]|nr:ribonuclease R [Betaproteobacteria bacterium]